MLTILPVLRSSGPRLMFAASIILTGALFAWMHQFRTAFAIHGLSPSFFILFAHYDYFATIDTLLILLGALFLAPHLPASKFLSWSGEHPVLIAACYAVLLVLGALLIYQNHPLSMDEYAAYFQSRVFAAGHLNGRMPPALLDWLIPPGFQNYFLNVSRSTGEVAETYWPGFALLLAPFTWAGVPWLCNPVISAFTLLVIHRIALQVFANREASGMALLLTAASPVIFANGISYYSMPAHLLANSVYALLLLRPNLRRAFAAGVVGSIALTLHNPVPHMLFAVPWVIWLATRQDGMRMLAVLCAGYLPLCIVLGIGWFIFCGQLIGAGDSLGAASVDTTQRLESMLSIFSLPHPNVVLARLIGVAKIWIWAIPGLLVLVGVGAVRRRNHAICLLLALSAVITLLGYFLVPVDQGHGWGYRYFHSAWMALPLIATAALFPPAELAAGPHPSSIASWFQDTEAKSYVTACIVMTLLLGIGLRAWQIRDFVTHDLDQLPHYPGTERRVVIIDGAKSFYPGDLVQNDPWLRGTEIRMYSRGAAADATMMSDQFPSLRRVYADRHSAVWSETGTAPEQPIDPSH